MRIAALNESDSDDYSSDGEDEPATTKEAEEAQAFVVYKRALGLQQSGDVKGADELFSGLLKHPFLIKVLHSDCEIDLIFLLSHCFFMFFPNYFLSQSSASST